jgi:hypothetical protein
MNAGDRGHSHGRAERRRPFDRLRWRRRFHIPFTMGRRELRSAFQTQAITAFGGSVAPLRFPPLSVYLNTFTGASFENSSRVLRMYPAPGYPADCASRHWREELTCDGRPVSRDVVEDFFSSGAQNAGGSCLSTNDRGRHQWSAGATNPPARIVTPRDFAQGCTRRSNSALSSGCI